MGGRLLRATKSSHAFFFSDSSCQDEESTSPRHFDPEDRFFSSRKMNDGIQQKVLRSCLLRDEINFQCLKPLNASEKGRRSGLYSTHRRFSSLPKEVFKKAGLPAPPPEQHEDGIGEDGTQAEVAPENAPDVAPVNAPVRLLASPGRSHYQTEHLDGTPLETDFPNCF